MQFLLIAYDANDEGALARRMAVRAEHMALVEQQKAKGVTHYGAAIIEGDKMVGSMMVVEYHSRKELDAWLKVEPYMTGKVWDKVTVHECRIAPPFVAKAA